MGVQVSATQRRALVAIGLLWLVAVLGGMTALTRYASTPGKPPEPLSRLPADSPLRPAPGRALLIMLAHPRCPCTRASLAELEQVLTRASRPVDTYVLFLRPETTEGTWEQGELWRRAASIPGVTVRTDAAGVAARSLGATTSGHVLLVDAQGHLRFSGGITRSRGHEGDNAGRATLEALLHGHQAPMQDRPPVYGCTLEEPAQHNAEGGAP